MIPKWFRHCGFAPWTVCDHGPEFWDVMIPLDVFPCGNDRFEMPVAKLKIVVVVDILKVVRRGCPLGCVSICYRSSLTDVVVVQIGDFVETSSPWMFGGGAFRLCHDYMT